MGADTSTRVLASALRGQTRSPPNRAGAPMCSKCDEIDENIERCRHLMDQINDKQIRQAANNLLIKLEQRKWALHPKE